MTAGTAITLRCDAAGCVASFWAADVDLAQARVNAEKARWIWLIHDDQRRDYCPIHRPT